MDTALLNSVPLFEDLTDAELESVAETIQRRTFPRDCMVILAEDQGDFFFVIGEGQVKVSVTSMDGREVILAVLGPGEFFGELALLDGQPRSANVVTLERSELLSIRRSDFLHALERYPRIAAKLLVSLAKRMRWADRQVVNMALLGITERISNVLLFLAEEEADSGEMVIRKRPTHQVIANMAGTARETVTRVLGRLEAEGYILFRGRELVIRERE